MKSFLSKRLIWGFLTLFVTSFQLKAQSLVVGAIGGSPNVSSSGAFTYEIPIVLPPGIKEMIPTISLNYNSQAGNGLLGIGWSMSGLSSITRGASNIYYDRNVAPVNFSSSDRYLLDGQRLVATTSGMYSTTVKNFSTIKSLGSFGSSPESFVVTSKEGLKYEYGLSGNSRMLNQSGTEVVMWALEKVTDPNGNYIYYRYVNNYTAGVFYLSYIEYTGNVTLGILPSNRIEFNYEDRFDKNKSYVYNSFVFENQRLSNIYVKRLGAVIHSYRLQYADDFYSHLNRITELAASGDYLPTVEFTYGNTETTNAGNNTSVLLDPTYNISTGDFNGDGFSDCLALKPVPPAAAGYESPPEYKMYHNNRSDDLTHVGDGTFSYTTSYVDNKTMSADKRNFSENVSLAVDWNGDGKDDAITISYSTSKLKAYLNVSNSLGTGFETPSEILSVDGDVTMFTDIIRLMQVGDFVGNGKKQLLAALPLIPGSGTSKVYDLKIIGDSYLLSGTLTGEVKHFQAMDFDGDGKDEIFTTTVESGSRTKIYSTNITYDLTSGVPVSGALSLSVIADLGFPTQWHRVFFGDYNGDGKKDVLTWASGYNWEIGYSTSNNLAVFSFPVFINTTDPNASINDNNIRIADFNGDGKEDILEMFTMGSTFNFRINYAKGNNVFEPELMAVGDICGIRDDRMTVGDYNGDGQADILLHDYPGCYLRFIYFHKDEQRHLLKRIDKKNSLDPVNSHKYNISYLPMPKDPDYTPTGLSYPFSRVPIGGLKLAKTITDNVSMNKFFTYSGACVHKTGLGFRGFQHFYEYDYANNTTTRKSFNIYGFESVVPLSIKVYTPASVSASTLVSSNDYYFSEVTLPYRIKIVYPVSELSVNKVKNTQISTTYTYSGPSGAYPSLLAYGKPDAVTVNVSGGQEITTTTYVYNTSDANFYNQIKPAQCTTTVQRPSQPTYTREAHFTYNTAGQVSTSTIDPGTTHQKITANIYNGFGQLIQETKTPFGLPGVVTKFVYTTDGRFVTESIDPFNRSEYYSYNDWGKLLSKTNINGLTTTYTYDVFNRQITSTSPTGITTFTRYDWASTVPNAPSVSLRPFYAITNRTSGITGSVITFYDLYNREMRGIKNAFDGQLILTDKSYNSDGSTNTITDPYLLGSSSINSTSFFYDNLGRKIEETNASRTIITAYTDIMGGFTPAGFKVTVTNVSVSPTRSASQIYDGTGKVTRVEEPDNLVANVYHSNGNLERTVVNSSSFRLYTYDNYGNLVSESSPNKGITTYTYNSKDQLVSKTDAKGVTYTFTYDIIGRVLTKTSPDGIYTYEYDGTTPATYGRLKRVTTPYLGNETQYTYDLFSRMSSCLEIIDGSSFNTTYTYDNYNRTIRTIYPSSKIAENKYNNYGYFSEIGTLNTSGYMPLWTKDAQNVFGQTTEESYEPYGGSSALFRQINTYNDRGFLTNTQLGNIHGAVINNFSYVIDEATLDMISRKDENRNKTEVFTYDNLDRLLSAERFDGATSIGILNMTYTQQGNINTKSDISPHAWAYNRYAVTSIPNPSAVIPSFTQSVTVTPFDKVKTIEENGKKIVFTYGADDQRVMAKYYTGTTLNKTRYYVNGYEKTVDAAGNVEQISYLYAEGIPKVMLVGNGAYSDIRYVRTDHLGSITHILDQMAGIVEERSYDVWGRMRNPLTWTYTFTGLPPIHFDRGYTGQEHLHDFGIINLNGRLYDPLIGRMFSVDPYITNPFNSQTYNSYSYANNNPLKYIDPDGEFAILVPIIAAAVIGTANLAINASNGDVNNFKDGAVAFGAGALVGAALGSGISLGLAVPAVAGGLKIAAVGFGYPAVVGVGSGLYHGIGKGNWKPLENTGKIFAGNFYLDNNRTFGGQVFQGVSRFTREIPQTLVGHGYSQYRNALGRVDRVDYYGGATFSTRVDMSSATVWGVSMGNHINILNNENSFDMLKDPLLMHEYGHTYDSQLFGMDYLFGIGIPSALGAEWTEIRANRYAKKRFSKFGVNWDDHEYNGYPTN